MNPFLLSVIPSAWIPKNMVLYLSDFKKSHNSSPPPISLREAHHLIWTLCAWLTEHSEEYPVHNEDVHLSPRATGKGRGTLSAGRPLPGPLRGQPSDQTHPRRLRNINGAKLSFNDAHFFQINTGTTDNIHWNNN